MDLDLRLVAKRVADGDVASFRQIVDHTRARLYRLAARLLGNVLDAEDALQDAYVSAFRAIREGRYDGRAAVETWIYRIVANRCVDLLRQRRTRAVEGTREPRFDGTVTAEARVALRELDALVAGLPPQERVALLLVTVEGLPVKEAADILGVSEGAVEQRLVRARTALRAQWREREASHERP